MDERRIEAARKGEPKYLGRICRRCNTAERYTLNGACVICAKAASQRSNAHQRRIIGELYANAQKGGE
jgi:hypothetical protein